MVVSDGSFKDGIGMVSSIVVGDSPSLCLQAVNMIPSHREDINSYCSELRGLYGIEAIVKQVMSYHSIHGGAIKVGSSCLVGLQWAFTSWFKSSPSKVHHNLISTIHRKVAKSPLCWWWHHIEGY